MASWMISREAIAADTKKHFKKNVACAWEQIASDAGEEDGCNAVDHLEQVFFYLLQFYTGDAEMQACVTKFDPELVQWAKEELKTYG